MRKIFAAALALLLSCGAWARAAEMPVDADSATGALLMEKSSGAILMEKNGESPYEAAGLLRVPALLMVCEAIDAGELSLQQRVQVSERAAGIGGSSAFLEAYETLSVNMLLKAAVMILAGDAVFALAEALSASEEVLLDRLNGRLGELGISAVYGDLLGSGVKLSAGELAALGRALSNSTAYRSCSMLYNDKLIHESGRETDLTSANKLLKSCTGCIGGLTGSSATAGYCGVFMVQRGNACYIAVVVGAKNAAERANAASAMIEYAFSAYSVKLLAKNGDIMMREIPVRGGTAASTDLVAMGDISLILRNGSYTAEQECPEELQAPVSRGGVYGQIRYFDESGEEIALLSLTVREDVPAATALDMFKRILNQWIFA